MVTASLAYRLVTVYVVASDGHVTDELVSFAVDDSCVECIVWLMMECVVDSVHNRVTSCY